MDENVANFLTVTGTDSPTKAQRYLQIADNDLAQAVELFFNGVDVGDAPAAPSGTGTAAAPISVDDDEEADFQEAVRSSRAGAGMDYEDDEALARRLQREMESEGAVRAPIARTRETLVGPDEDFMHRMQERRRRNERAGIFNQQAPSVWDPDAVATSSSARRQMLSEATGGASEASARSNRLAQMYRPPFEIMSHLDLEDARTEAKEQERWILVNIQESGNFQCQVLNRDIWKQKEVMDTIKENFIFLQYDRTGPDGLNYLRLYMPQAQLVPVGAELSPFPHVAIIDPRTGEKVKEWTETPTEPLVFVQDLHEFLSRYSLDLHQRNPVTKSEPVPKVLDPDRMTEEEMLEWAMQNSLETAGAGAGSGTGASTPPEARNGKRKKDADESSLMDLSESEKPALKRTGSATAVSANDTAQPASPYFAIPAVHHTEPPPGPTTTRIQFRFADGSRVVRRFAAGDHVERIFSWIKADLVPEKFPDDKDKEFELVSMGKKLIESLGSTIEEAGLKNGTVMVAVIEGDDEDAE